MIEFWYDYYSLFSIPLFLLDLSITVLKSTCTGLLSWSNARASNLVYEPKSNILLVPLQESGSSSVLHSIAVRTATTTNGIQVLAINVPFKSCCFRVTVKLFFLSFFRQILALYHAHIGCTYLRNLLLRTTTVLVLTALLLCRVLQWKRVIALATAATWVFASLCNAAASATASQTFLDLRYGERKLLA